MSLKQVRYHTLKETNFKGTDQTVQMLRLVKTFVVCMQQSRVFWHRGPYYNIRPLVKSATEKIISYFLTKTYAEGTQKYGLNQRFLLSTQNMSKLIRKYSQFYA